METTLLSAPDGSYPNDDGWNFKESERRSISAPAPLTTAEMYLKSMNWVHASGSGSYNGIYKLSYTVKCYFYWPPIITSSLTKTMDASSTEEHFYDFPALSKSSCPGTVTFSTQPSETVTGQA